MLFGGLQPAEIRACEAQSLDGRRASILCGCLNWLVDDPHPPTLPPDHPPAPPITPNFSRRQNVPVVNHQQMYLEFPNNASNSQGLCCLSQKMRSTKYIFKLSRPTPVYSVLLRSSCNTYSIFLYKKSEGRHHPEFFISKTKLVSVLLSVIWFRSYVLCRGWKILNIFCPN